MKISVPGKNRGKPLSEAEGPKPANCKDESRPSGTYQEIRGGDSAAADGYDRNDDSGDYHKTCSPPQFDTEEKSNTGVTVLGSASTTASHAGEQQDCTSYVGQRSGSALPVINNTSESGYQSAIEGTRADHHSWVRIPFPLSPFVPTRSTTLPSSTLASSSDNDIARTPSAVGGSKETSNGNCDIDNQQDTHATLNNFFFGAGMVYMRQLNVDSINDAADAAWEKLRTLPRAPSDPGSE